MRTLLLILAPNLALALPPVERVVVFGDRAQITRAEAVPCAGDEARVVFFPLPLSLDERTVRAEATGKASAVGTTMAIEPLDRDRDDAARAARTALEAADVVLRRLAVERGQVAGDRAVLGRYPGYLKRSIDEGLRQPTPAIGTWTTALDRLRARTLANAAADLKLRTASRAAQRERARLATRAALLDPQNAQRGRRVEVAVDCQGAARTTVRLAYVVPGATWRPEYDLRFQPRGAAKTGPGTAELVVSAVIQQSTGEAWTDAQVVLSSARPWLGVRAPEPRPLSVHAVRAGDEKVLVQATERREKLEEGKERAQRTASGATVADAGTAVTLSLPRRVTIKSDGRPYWVPIDAMKTAAIAKLVAVPKMEAQVYQVVGFDNPTGYPLLAGRLHTFRRGTYVGDSRLEHKGPGEPVEISLGVDTELRLERAPRKDKNKKAGFLSSTKHMERAYEIIVKNGGAAAATVEVREHIPVSKNAAIKVELVKKKTTAGYAHDKERGFLTWPVQIPAGGEERVDLAYTVHLPEDWKVRR